MFGFFSDLSIPLEDNQLCAARSTVLDFAKNLQEKKNKHEENLQDAREIVFLGKIVFFSNNFLYSLIFT